MKDIADDLALIVRNAIDYINKLEQQINELKRKPMQEPMAWRTFDGEGGYDYWAYEDNENYHEEYVKRNGEKYASWVEPLYTAPPQRKPLTDEEIRQIALDTPIGGTNFARAIERAHGIGGQNE